MLKVLKVNVRLTLQETTTMSKNPNDLYRSLFRSLGMPLLLGCLGLGCVLFILGQRERAVERIKTDLRHIPPEWMPYRQTSLFACPVVGKPTCFALLGNSTFVVGSADPHALSLFDGQGTLLKKIDLSEEPKAIVCGGPDTIFTDKIIVAHAVQIVVYSVEGDYEFELWDELAAGTIAVSRIDEWVDTPGFRFPRYGFHSNHYSFKEKNFRSLILTSDSLFVADSGNRCLYRFVSGELIAKTFGLAQPRNIHFSLWDDTFRGFVVYASPITMTISPTNDLLYITNPGRHRVEVFTQNGTYRPDLSWGEPSGDLDGFVGCCNPIDIAALDDGRILTVEKAISRIKIYGTDGKLDCVVAGPDTLDEVPAKLGRTPAEPGGRYFSAVPLSNGRIAVFDYEYSVVRVFSPL